MPLYAVIFWVCRADQGCHVLEHGVKFLYVRAIRVELTVRPTPPAGNNKYDMGSKERNE